MDTKLIQVHCDVECFRRGVIDPKYRIYVNNELFTERTWIWHNEYLEEMIQIEAEAGKYRIRYELVPPHLSELTVDNFRVEHGPAKVKQDGYLRIQDES